MRDNLVAMSDLSDDEGSPTHGKTEDVVKGEIGQAFQAYQVGQHLVDQMNVEIANEEERNVGEGMGSDSDSSDSENLPEQLRRYLHIPLDQASDPELWMEIHHGGSNSERSMESNEMDEHQSDEET